MILKLLVEFSEIQEPIGQYVNKYKKYYSSEK